MPHVCARIPPRGKKFQFVTAASNPICYGDKKMNPQTGFMRFPEAAALCIPVALGLASCGKGMSSNGDMGTVDIGITDGQGDFISYAVDVTSLTLTKADGTVVETLPQKTRIDFAQLVDLSEFVTSATIPAGNYVS